MCKTIDMFGTVKLCFIENTANTEIYDCCFIYKLKSRNTRKVFKNIITLISFIHKLHDDDVPTAKKFFSTCKQ